MTADEYALFVGIFTARATTPRMEALPSHSWFVTMAYTATALGVGLFILRTWLRHVLATRALRALEAESQHES